MGPQASRLLDALWLKSPPAPQSENQVNPPRPFFHTPAPGTEGLRASEGSCDARGWRGQADRREKDTDEALGAVEHGDSREETGQLDREEAQGDREGGQQPAHSKGQGLRPRDWQPSLPSSYLGVRPSRSVPKSSLQVPLLILLAGEPDGQAGLDVAVLGEQGRKESGGEDGVCMAGLPAAKAKGGVGRGGDSR